MPQAIVKTGVRCPRCQHEMIVFGNGIKCEKCNWHERFTLDSQTKKAQ